MAKGRLLVKGIYKISIKEIFKNDYELIRQLRKAAISIMLNISEGFARRTNNEFKYFLYTAHGSVAEVQSCLYIALDCRYINNEDFEKFYSDSEEISKIISGLIKSLK